MIVLNRDGSSVAFLGYDNMVSAADDYKWQVGSVTLHNHPRGSPPSLKDIENIVAYEKRTSIVVTREKVYVIEKVESKPLGATGGEFGLMRIELWAAKQRANDEGRTVTDKMLEAFRWKQIAERQEALGLRIREV